MACDCGHVEDEHDEKSGSCTIADCLCAGYDEADEEEDESEEWGVVVL